MKRNRAALCAMALSLVFAGLMPLTAGAAKTRDSADSLKADPALKSTEKQPNKSPYVVKIHGNAFVPEHPGLLLPDGIRRRGWGVNFLAPEGTLNWFHAPLPVYVDDEREGVRLKTIFLLFRSDKTIVTDIHVWDGSRLIKGYTKMQLSGDHGGKIDNMNQFVIDVPDRITSGLGISVGVKFNTDGVINGRNVGEIVLVGAGAVYEK